LFNIYIAEEIRKVKMLDLDLRIPARNCLIDNPSRTLRIQSDMESLATLTISDSLAVNTDDFSKARIDKIVVDDIYANVGKQANLLIDSIVSAHTRVELDGYLDIL